MPHYLPNNQFLFELKLVKNLAVLEVEFGDQCFGGNQDAVGHVAEDTFDRQCQFYGF
jgi:hypothetical protein